MLQTYTKKTYRDRALIKIYYFIENWIGKKLHYSLIIRLSEKYLKTDIEQALQTLMAHCGTLENVQLIVENEQQNKRV